MPSAAYLGTLDNADSTLYYNRQLAATLKELGVNLNYAPVLDMAVNADNTVVVKSGRTFGASYEAIAKHASLCVQAHHEYSIKTVFKHFPGHGSSSGDSHFGIADVTNTWRLRELMPYDSLFKSANYDAVMTGHIVNQKWDAGLLPATLSATSNNTILRGLLGFKGAVFSDDMQMDAISDHYGFENAIVMAINAGVDVLMFANTTKNKEKIVTASQVHKAMKKMVKKHKVSRERIDEAYDRIMTLKNKTV